MKSIKRGRAPSMMGGIGALVVAFFGVIWTFSAASMGAPAPFSLFGVVFVIMSVSSAIYNFKNATGQNRYSEFDITDENEEPDPFNIRYQNPDRPKLSKTDEGANFCPYCGASVMKDHQFCKKCGENIGQ